MLDEAANKDDIARNDRPPNMLAQLFRYFCSTHDTFGHILLKPRRQKLNSDVGFGFPQTFLWE